MPAPNRPRGATAVRAEQAPFFLARLPTLNLPGKHLAIALALAVFLAVVLGTEPTPEPAPEAVDTLQEVAAPEPEAIEPDPLRQTQMSVEEMGAQASPENRKRRLETDEFDPHFDHLILIDRERLVDDPLDQVLGVYRLMRADAAANGASCGMVIWRRRSSGFMRNACAKSK